MAKMDIHTRQEIELIVMQMLARYAQLEDARQWELLSQMYETNGRLIRPENPLDVIEGREAIASALTVQAASTTRHIVSNVLVDVEHPARFNVQSTVLRFTGAPKSAGDETPPAMTASAPAVISYSDLIVLEPKGYVFAERRGGFDFAP